MSPQKRLLQNRPLPARWVLKNNAYYYRVPPGLESSWDGKKWFRLGASLSEAHKSFAERVDKGTSVSTVGQLLDRYLIEVIPTKAPKTQTENRRYHKHLRAVFADVPLDAITPQTVYQYADKRTAKRAAKLEIEMFSHVFTMAVQWGLVPRHPFKGEVTIKGSAPRDRYVEDWEIIAALSIKGHRRRGSIRMVQSYIRIKLMTGISRADMLQLRADQLTDEGILVSRHKVRNSSGKRTLYKWTPELREAVEEAKHARPVDISPWLFCRMDGGCLWDESTGEAKPWDNIWQNFIARVLAVGVVKKRFTEHDLRAKCASDAESLEHARALLSHVDSRLTNRIYRRKVETVEPLAPVKKLAQK